MEKRIVRINTKKEYDVIIGKGLLSSFGKAVLSVCGNCRAAIITDSNVAKYHLETVSKSLNDAGIANEAFIFPAGEESKNIFTLSDILEFLAKNHFVRSDLIVALGGGVVGDIAGFAAAIYLRGIRFVQMPTSLLAAVDSSVGGKTAIDLKEGKNLAGAFLQPELVICDTDTLATLPKEEYINGLCEAIKYGILFDEELFSGLESKALSDTDLIEKCVLHKGAVVANDEFDKGERQLLNLGHTIGHAIEKCSGFKMKHGYAVAQGMAMISKAGEALGLTKKGTYLRICALFSKLGISENTDFSEEELLSVCLNDKKRQKDYITLVIPKRIGECILKKEPVSALGEYIKLGKEKV